MPADPVTSAARRTFGFDRLRPGQREAIDAVLAGRDTLVVMPTGAGKSAIYQIAAVLIDGPTVVVSPLIALQRDQVAVLTALDVGGAAEANSTIGVIDQREAFADLRSGDLEFLFLAPEQLNRAETVERLVRAQPSLVVVDEAHCVSAWGHDFRPDYLRLGSVVELLGHPTVLALTATASPPVRAEIVERLGLREPVTVVRGFDRPNIELAVQTFVDGHDKEAAIDEHLRRLPRPGIVYVATRRRAEDVAARAEGLGLRAAPYHGSLGAARRRRAQEAFMAGGLDVVVATNAFGMGIDKADVRFVLHADVPDSLDSYYQEVGRAGRDGERADGILLFRPEDLGVRRFLAGGAALGAERLLAVAAAIWASDGPIDRDDLVAATRLGRVRVSSAVTRLQGTGAVDALPGGGAQWRQGADPAAAADEAATMEETRRQLQRSRLEMMRSYADSRACRGRTLVAYFGEHLPEPCGHCDNCHAGRVDDDAEGRVADDDALAATQRVVHDVWGEGQVLRREGDRLVVLFDEVGYKTLSVEAVTEGNLLEPAG